MKNETLQPKSDYQKMLHQNYHINKQYGPASDCPYCPPKRIIRGG